MDFSECIDWVIKNKEWLFSGIGLAVITAIYKLVKNKKNVKEGNTFIQINQDESRNNIQAKQIINKKDKE